MEIRTLKNAIRDGGCSRLFSIKERLCFVAKVITTITASIIRVKKLYTSILNKKLSFKFLSLNVVIDIFFFHLLVQNAT